MFFDYVYGVFQVCMGVEEVVLCICFQQQLMCVLIVDVDQLFVYFVQLCQCDGGVVDEGFVVVGGIDCVMQQDYVFVVVQFMCFELCGYMWMYIEFGGDVGMWCVFVYDSCIGVFIQCECKCIDQDGFVCVGFVCKYGKIVGQIEIQCVNDDEIVDGEVVQYGRGECGVLVFVYDLQ